MLDNRMLEDRIGMNQLFQLLDAINKAGERQEGTCSIEGVCYTGARDANIHFCRDEQMKTVCYKKGKMLLNQGEVGVVRKFRITVSDVESIYAPIGDPTRDGQHSE